MPLKLTRKIGQKLFIGDDVTITVIDVRGHQVKLMIEAPDNIVILRDELAARMAAEGCRIGAEGCIDKRMEH